MTEDERLGKVRRICKRCGDTLSYTEGLESGICERCEDE